MMGLAIDLVLITALLLVSWQALSEGSLLRGIVMFIVFGLAMALAWARLGAPDLAMAEAAIGAGVTGALMLVAYRRLLLIHPEQAAAPTRRRSRLALPVGILSAVLVAMIGLAAVQMETDTAAAGETVIQQTSGYGLGNPITAVLLVFRNLDTVLEMTVLLVAFLAARAIQEGEVERMPVAALGEIPLVGALLAVIVPLTVLVAVHLLKAGSQEPGGAFQAGSVLAACGVLLLLAGRVEPARSSHVLIRIGLLTGLVSFCLIGLGAMTVGQPLFDMPGLWAIYLIETCMMISIALTLTLLFSGGGGLRPGDA